MWPFKSKYEKLKREDVVNAICDLEKEEANIEDSILQNNNKVNELMEKGKVEKSRELKLFYAKKINSLKESNKNNINRGMYLLYNIKMLDRLKQAIDDNQFFENTGNVSLGNLLSDQKGLAVFLNKTLNRKIKAENILTSSDEIWNEVQDSYIENEQIYGVQNHDDELLAMFETQSQLDDELNLFDEESSEETGKLDDELNI